MNTCRLLLICPQFWPNSEPRSLLATAFAGALAESGHLVTVVTRHLIGYWPRTFRMGCVDVVRLSQRNTRLMDSMRGLGGGDPWIRELSRWLPSHRTQFDFAIVVAGDSEVSSIASVLRRWEVKSVVRVEDQHLLESQIEFDKRDPMLIWTTPYDSPGRQKSVVFIADGGDIIGISADSRNTLRRALKNAHPMLEIPGSGPMALCSSPLEKRRGVFELVTAWQVFLQTCPSARLWLVGSGADGYQLFQHIRNLDIEHAVIMPGSFDHARDLIMAADAIVLPGRELHPHNESGFFVVTAIENRLPMICHAGHWAIRLREHLAEQRESGCTADAGELWTFCDPENSLASVLFAWNDWRTASVEDTETNLVTPTNPLREMALRYIEFGQTMMKTIGEHSRNQGLTRQEAHSRNETDFYDRR